MSVFLFPFTSPGQPKWVASDERGPDKYRAPVERPRGGLWRLHCGTQAGQLCGQQDAGGQVNQDRGDPGPTAWPQIHRHGLLTEQWSAEQWSQHLSDHKWVGVALVVCGSDDHKWVGVALVDCGSDDHKWVDCGSCGLW